MSAILWSFLEPVLPYISAVLLLIFGIIGAFLRGKSSGKATERAKQTERDKAALGEQIEMNREATQIERETAAQTEADARAEANRWAKR